MYVDPSRVQMAIRFARIAAGSAVEREGAVDDLRVFLDALWADATAEGRSRYMTAAARAPGGLPWAAVILPDGPGMAVGGMPALAGPAVVELIVGQADPDDEGVAGYRLASGDPRAEAIVDALFGWDTPQIERTAASAGWRLEAVEELGEMRAVRGAEDVEPGVVDEGVELPGEGGAAIEAPTIPGDWSSWKRVALVSAGVLGGFAALGWAARRWG